MRQERWHNNWGGRRKIGVWAKTVQPHCTTRLGRVCRAGAVRRVPKSRALPACRPRLRYNGLQAKILRTGQPVLVCGLASRGSHSPSAARPTGFDSASSAIVVYDSGCYRTLSAPASSTHSNRPLPVLDAAICNNYLREFSMSDQTLRV